MPGSEPQSKRPRRVLQQPKEEINDDPPLPPQQRNIICKREDEKNEQVDASSVTSTSTRDPELRDFGFCCAFCKCDPEKQSLSATSPGFGAAYHRHCCHGLADGEDTPNDWKSPIDLALEDPFAESNEGSDNSNNNNNNPTQTMSLKMLKRKMKTAKKLETQNKTDDQDVGE